MSLHLRIFYNLSTDFYALSAGVERRESIGNTVRSGIEVVITGLTWKRVTTSEPVFRKVLILQGFGGIIQEKNFCSSLHQFSPFSGVLFGGWCCEKYTQRYRSGHNGADSKSVWEQSHEGSNPSRCAKKVQSTSGFKPFVGFSFWFLEGWWLGIYVPVLS